MTAELIHPFDLYALLKDRTIDEIVAAKSIGDNLHEIDGRLYYETTRVPAKTKEIA